MQIRYGYELMFCCPQSTPMILMLHTHPSRVGDLLKPDTMVTDPPSSLQLYSDAYGNTCTRLIATPGQFKVTADALIADDGLPDPIDREAREHAVETLPNECLMYLLASRYCETETLMSEAWRMFGDVQPGWARVQAIVDFSHEYLTFGYEFARSTKTAWNAYTERQGVCRDFAHLAITLCRCMNIPARYCTGYLGDIGVPPMPEPMDFAGWMEVYIGHKWHTFDPRHNQRRIGRILIARGRDAADVAISTTFGTNYLQSFRVWTDQVDPNQARDCGQAPHLRSAQGPRAGANAAGA
jgi:transglutaminase-like putative cysteine protease